MTDKQRGVLGAVIIATVIFILIATWVMPENPDTADRAMASLCGVAVVGMTVLIKSDV